MSVKVVVLVLVVVVVVVVVLVVVVIYSKYVRTTHSTDGAFNLAFHTVV